MRARTPREVGLLVRERRRDLGMSQQQLAERADVSRPWLVAVEQGHPRAELGKVLSLLSELGLDLDLSHVPSAAGSLADPDDPGLIDLDALLAQDADSDG